MQKPENGGGEEQRATAARPTLTQFFDFNSSMRSAGVQRSVRDFFAASSAKRPAEAGAALASPAKKRAAGVVTAAAVEVASVGGAQKFGAPPPLPPPPRDLAAAKAAASTATALVAQRVAAAEGNGLHPALADLLVDEAWSAALAPVLQPRAAAPLQRFLEGEWGGRVPVYPPKHLIFRALNEVPLEAVRVVIIGQVRRMQR